ncbi:MAG: MoxR family ATPase [Lachnospiraceae bacterium]|nr:MoxR family ATPase [Lachnospiraceae bacterium]
MSSAKYASSILEEVKKQVVGKDATLGLILCALLSGGHVLIDDIPGVGKTTMAVAFEKAMGLTGRRMQFTPDVLPSDILGFSVYDKETGRMNFREGAVFCNLFLADEINRTSPKTQAALLEVMEEKQVTADGVTRLLPDPFFVIATQNPTGSVGTQKLPESEIDRFLICVSMGYPTVAEEAEILKRKNNSMGEVERVADRSIILQMQSEVKDIFVHDAVYDYMARLVQATRNNSYIELGGSPRATVSLMQMSMAYAYLTGRDYVLPEDAAAVFIPVMNHRIIRSRRARLDKVPAEDILTAVLRKEKRPTERRKQE